MDTIYALATARGKAGVAVVRVSGLQAHDVAERLAGRLPPARQMALRKLRDPQGEILDEALVVVFESESSFTGEPVVEFHLHGSPAVVSAVLRVLAGQPGLRLAEPGEFTRRALENGRLDLAQVEGLADLIEAETEAQRRQAQRVFQGEMGRKVAGWRADLVRALALVEAVIDFADEELPDGVLGEVQDILSSIIKILRLELSGSGAAERIRQGFEVAIVGPPNIGKSTLLNRLAGREAAITSEIAGTTRDVIEVRMDLSGLPVTFLDTAGIRDTDDRIETLGVKRARQRAEAADLRVFLIDDEEPGVLGITPRQGDIIARGKGDLVHGQGMLAVSGKTGQGVSELILQISGILEQRVAGASTAIRERHVQAIRRAIGFLESAQERLSCPDMQDELIAADLHQAARLLDSLIGKVDVEQLLDEIFASFCLGK